MISTMHVNSLVDETMECHFVLQKTSLLSVIACFFDFTQPNVPLNVGQWQLGKNILDNAALNPWIVFKSATDSNVSGKDFPLQLTSKLCHKEVAEAAAQHVQPTRAACSTKSCKN